jgi:hypothetical protein
VNVETKEQSKKWRHTHLPSKTKTFKQTLPARKLMATVFWDRKGSADGGIRATRDDNNVGSVLRAERLLWST